MDGSDLWPVIHRCNICNALIHADYDVCIMYFVSPYNCRYNNELLLPFAHKSKCFALKNVPVVCENITRHMINSQSICLPTNLSFAECGMFFQVEVIGFNGRICVLTCMGYPSGPNTPHWRFGPPYILDVLHEYGHPRMRVGNHIELHERPIKSVIVNAAPIHVHNIPSNWRTMVRI